MRQVCIYTPNGQIGSRRCTEHANKKQVVTKHFRGSGRHKYIKKRCKQGGIEALATSVSYRVEKNNISEANGNIYSGTNRITRSAAKKNINSERMDLLLKGIVQRILRGVITMLK